MKHILSTILLAAFFFSVKAQVSFLDSTFNGTGIFQENLGGGQDRPIIALARPNGKSIEVGFSYFSSHTASQSRTLVTVAQFDINGQPDSSFGVQGVVVLHDLKTDARAAGAVFQTDGKLLITGRYLNSTLGPHHFVVRLNEDGSLDSGFGTGGVTGHPDQNLVAWGNTVAVQSDGKILMGGRRYTDTPQGGYFDFSLIRFDSNGLVDNGFGNGGLVTTDLGPLDSWVLSIAIDSDTSIVAGGIYGGWNGKSVLARYHSTGQLDDAFGQGGYIYLPDGGGTWNVFIQPDDKIIAGGAKIYGNGFVRRFNTDGSADSSFEDLGPLNYLVGLAEQPDGKVLAVSYEWGDSVGFHVFRYLPDGQIDPSYGGFVKIPGWPFDPAAGLALQPDGKIILGGQWYDEFGFLDFCLLRLTESLAVDSTFGADGLAKQNSGLNLSSAKSVFLDNQNRIVVGGELTSVDATTIINLPLTTGIGFIKRFNSDGSLDTTFSGDGLVTTYKSDPYSPPFAHLIAKQVDEKILSVRCSGNVFMIERWLPDGTADADFGFNGYMNIFIESNGYEADARAVSVGADGKIVVMGTFKGSDSKKRIAIARFDEVGWPDISFGTDGVMVSDQISGTFQLNAGLVQPDGKVLVCGTYGSVSNIFLIRFLSDGTLDNTFGAGGLVQKPFSAVALSANALTIQPNGQLVLCGHQGGGSNQNILVGRLNTDGTKDETFSSDGYAIVNVATVETGNALAVQANGKIVVAGKATATTPAGASDPVLVRFFANGSLDSTLAGTGFVVTDIPGSNEAKALAIQPDGNYVVAGQSETDYFLIRYLHKLSVGLVDAQAVAMEVLVYPNPVFGQTTFEYTLSAPGRVSLELFDIQGKLVTSFFQEENRMTGANTEVIFIPKCIVPGVYFLRVRTAFGSKSVQIVLT